jgi:hypothetical protein
MATARPRIGELLLATGVCSRDELREAWESKVLYGDRLGTNLLALGYIDEAKLAGALGQQLGVHSGHGTVIAPDAGALKLVPKSLAVKRLVVPHHVVDKTLYVLMRDPLDANAVDEVAFAASMKVTPVVVCEARIWQLIERHYGTVMSLRPVPLDGVQRVSPSHLDDASTTTIALGPELTSEEEFNRLYAGIHVGTPIETSQEEFVPPPITPLPLHQEAKGAPVMSTDFDVDKTSPARPIAILAERDPHGTAGVLAPPAKADPHEWRDAIEKTNPMMARPRFTAENEPEIIDLVEVSSDIPHPVEMAPPLVRQSTADFHVPKIEPPVDESPLSFADASRLLAKATDRDEIAHVVLRAARTKFQRACLLSVFPDRFVGFVGIGDGMNMKDVVIPRSDKSVFSLVADSRSHYLGPLGRLPAHGRWVKATGRKIPKSIAVFPILVRGRPVNLLVVDNGHDQHVGSDVGEVLILAQQIAKTYETLLTSA